MTEKVEVTPGLRKWILLISTIAALFYVFFIFVPPYRREAATQEFIKEASGVLKDEGQPVARIDYMRRLISQGADINGKYTGEQTANSVTRLMPWYKNTQTFSTDPFIGYTALHFCTTWYYDKRALHFLLENGADVNARNAHGETPLMLAARNGSYDIVKLLLSEGADINLRRQPLPQVARGRIKPGPQLKGDTALRQTQRQLAFARKSPQLMAHQVPQLNNTVRVLKAAGGIE